MIDPVPGSTPLGVLFRQVAPARPPLRVAVVTKSPHDDPDVNVHARQLVCPGVLQVAMHLRVGADHGATKGSRSVLEVSGGAGHASILNRLISWYAKWDMWRHTTPRKDVTSGSPQMRWAESRVLDCAWPLSEVESAKLAVELQECQIDIILAPGCVPLPRQVVAASRYGVWSLRYGAQAMSSGYAGVLSDMVEGRQLTQAHLVADVARSGRKYLIEAVNEPVGRGFSVAVVLRALNASANALPLCAIRRLQQLGWSSLAERPDASALSDDGPAETRIRIPQALSFILRRMFKSVRWRVTGQRERQWGVCVRAPSKELPWRDGWNRFVRVNAPPGSCIADPCVFDHDGQAWLFVERIESHSNRGSIAVSRLDSCGLPGEWLPVLERPYHLSFPFVFVQQGHVYMIPESAQAGSVDLYRAERFPDKWVLERTLWNSPALDTALHVGDDGTHYFFCTVRYAHQSTGFQLLFTAPDLYSPWSLHPASPISLDCRYARSAGPLVVLDGRLHRVAQDSAPYYGRRMHFLEVDVLTPDAYHERLVGTLEPPTRDGALGAHSFWRGGRWEAVDFLEECQQP